MVYQNGRIPTSALAPIEDGLFLEDKAARAWIPCRAAIREETGIDPDVTNPDGAYRTFERQEYWREYWTAKGTPHFASIPGKSPHGRGVSVDLYNVTSYNLDELERIARRFGFIRDVPYEIWHFTHDGSTLAPASSTATPITITPPPEAEDEDTMAKTIQIHYKRADGQLVRALATPGTGYFAPWREAGATIANSLATALDTGNSVEVTESMFTMLQRTAQALHPRDLITVEIADAEL